MVLVRLRPKSSEEVEADTARLAKAASSGNAAAKRMVVTDTVSVLSDTEMALFDNRARVWRPFAFDGVLGPNANQERVFR